MNKRAADDTQFERTFSDLAFSDLSSKAPGLLDYMVGFQIVDKNDDGTHAVGVFGFEISKQWLYVPVFFMNGELKGMDLLYVKNKDVFVPLQENWVNYLTSKRPAVLGEESDYTDADLSFSNPDFNVYARSPLRNSYYKYSAYDPDKKDWITGYWHKGNVFDITPALRCFQINPNGPTFKTASEHLDLSKLVKEFPKLASVMAGMIGSKPGLMKAFDKFYSPQDLFSCLFEKKAESVTKPASTPKKSDAIIYTDVEIITDKDIPSDVTDTERKSLVYNGLAVRDGRKDESKSQIYDIDDVGTLTNPTESGVYDVLCSGGKFERCLVIVNPKTIGTGNATCVTVIVLSSGACKNLERGSVFARQIVDTTMDAAVKDAVDISDMVVGKHYVLICDCGGTLPFRVVEKTDDTVYVNPRSYIDRSGGCVSRCDCDRGVGSPNGMPQFSDIRHDHPSMSLENAFDNSIDTDIKWLRASVRPIVISETVSHFKTVGNTLLAPKAAKAVTVTNSDFTPGTITDAEFVIRKEAGLHELSVKVDLGDFVIESPLGARRFSKSAAAVTSLILDEGLSFESAIQMTGEAYNMRVSSKLVKYAQPTSELIGTAPGAPSVGVIDNTAAFDPQLGVLSATGASATQAIPMPVFSPQDYNTMVNTPSWQQGQTPAAVAEQAAQTGQKEVFDLSVLTGLVNAKDVSGFVDKYLSDLTVGMDRVGRILFMYYWHNERFAERYGEEEMIELEDSLRNTFKALGDLILFLRKRTIEPILSSVGTDVSLV